MKRFITNPRRYHGAILSDLTFLHGLSHNRTFSAPPREDHDLTDKLLAELPAILNWAIEGWQRLQERGRFVQPQSSAESIQAQEDLSSPSCAFIRDRCTVAPSLEVGTKDLFNDIARPVIGECRGGEMYSSGPNRDHHA